jgi:hypothetical protein
MRKHYNTYPGHPLGVRSHQMGSLVFHVAYRTMDTTFAHEAVLFGESLRYYMEAYQKYSQSGRTVYFLEDQMLVLYVALGHDEVAFEEIYSFLKVSQNNVATRTAKIPHINEDLLTHLPDAPWRLSLLTVLLLIKMRLVARLRQREREFRAYQRTTGGRTLEQVDSVLHEFLVGDTHALNSQEKQVQQLVQRIPYALRRTICTARPLTQWDAPSLFHYMAPPECWQILQDCFTSEPGIEYLMQEYMLLVGDGEQQEEAMILDGVD